VLVSLYYADRNISGLPVDTSANTSNYTANDQVWQFVSRRLETGAHDDESHSNPNHAAAAEEVTDEEVDNAAGESAETVRGDDDAGFGVIGMTEEVEPVLVLQDATEDTV
jgi:hypothetical protein